MENLNRSGDGTYCTLRIAHCSLGIWGPPTAGSWGGATSKIRTRIGTMNAGFSPRIQGYRRFGIPPICGSPESAGKTSLVHGERDQGGIKGEGPCFFHTLGCLWSLRVERRLLDAVQGGNRRNVDEQFLHVEPGSNERLAQAVHHVRTISEHRLLNDLVEQ